MGLAHLSAVGGSTLFEAGSLSVSRHALYAAVRLTGHLPHGTASTLRPVAAADGPNPKLFVAPYVGLRILLTDPQPSPQASS